LFGASATVRADALLQLFNVSWGDLIQKMPEIAEAGYTSLWLPPPTKASSSYSVGYDVFDPFDLADKNQRGSIATHWGTKAQLLQVVEVAHRFGIRVYFDNITNHRSFDVPGYDSNTSTNLYPGMRPQDFHLQTVSGGFFRNWPNISNYNDQWQVQNQPLAGLIDIANEPGSNNNNFGPSLGSIASKISFVRHPGSNSYYMDTSLPYIAGPWRPFNGTNGVPVSEDVNAYLIRSAMWLLNETKCDGFRLDAVKHVPSGFFGDTSDSPNGYLGAIQTMFNYVHGYGANVTGNGYMEAGDNRDSVFDTETTRNDAMVFGEHLGEPPSYSEYITRGMRLLNVPLENYLASNLGNPSGTLSGLDQRDFVPPGSDGFSSVQGVQISQSHDYANPNQAIVTLQDAYDFMREGLPEVYSDGWNLSTAPSGQSPFPANSFTSYLGEFGDNRVPEIAWLHHQLARGGTRSRWSDNDTVAFERYDYRDVDQNTAYTNPDATVLLFVMNDNFGNPGDISFDDSIVRPSDGYYGCYQSANLRHIGLVVGFPPGSVLSQMASSSPGANRACPKLLVHYATQTNSEAVSTANDPTPINRKIYVGGQALAPGGGAIELTIPSGGWVCYGYQWPEPSRASLKDAITFQQGGAQVPRLTVYRKDGANGDPNFNPYYPFKMRGSVDPNGNVVGGVYVSNLTYSIDVPVLTNASFNIALRADASAVNMLARMDGGLDLNSQMGLGPTSGLDRRDNRPGYASDVFLGYEQALQQFRYGPEKFAATLVSRNNVTSLGAETYYYTPGGANLTVNGSGNGAAINTSTATWIYHDPSATNTASAPNNSSTQRVPLSPSAGQPVDIYVKVGYQFQTNHCYIYYTTDGTNPEGSFGTGLGTTRVVPAAWANHDSADATIDWFKGTIPASNQVTGVQVRYKVAVYQDNIGTISDSDASKLYGLTQFGITSFDPTTATVWLHNDLNTNNVTNGLRSGFHIVRARCFLPRNGKSGVFNTFLQTFYYESQLPSGVIAFPTTDGANLNGSSYTVVVRADSGVTAVEFNIQDSDPNNDDFVTGLNNGNGLTNGVAKFAAAGLVTPDPTLSQQYPAYPQEFRFTYTAVPSSGTATIKVRLKQLSTSVMTNRFTDLTRSVNTLAPAQVLQIADPATNGAIYVLSPSTVHTIRACFTSTLTTNDYTLFSILINGVFQPRTASNGTNLYRINPVACGVGYRALLYDWTNSLPGTNVIQVLYTNQVTLSDTRTIAVARPGDSDGDGMSDYNELIAGTDPYDPNSVLKIIGFGNGNQVIVWNSVSNINYQVLATTNLSYPMLPISPVINATGPTSFYFDSSQDPTNKFYRIQVIP
jgi:hypothetical protein